MDTAVWIGSIGSAVAGIGAAVAAGIMAWQMKKAGAQEAARYAWLRQAMLNLRPGTHTIPDDELVMALYWIHEGVLDVYPPTAADKFKLRLRS